MTSKWNNDHFVVELLAKMILESIKEILGQEEYRKLLIKIKLNKIESKIINLYCEINENVVLP